MLNHIKTASIINIKYNFNITRQIIMIWIKNINNNIKLCLKEYLIR